MAQGALVRPAGLLQIGSEETQLESRMFYSSVAQFFWGAAVHNVSPHPSPRSLKSVRLQQEGGMSEPCRGGEPREDFVWGESLSPTLPRWGEMTDPVSQGSQVTKRAHTPSRALDLDGAARAPQLLHEIHQVPPV